MRQSSPSQYISARLPDQISPSDEALLNDDKIGEATIARFGCDCTGCRRAIAQLFQRQINK